MRNKDQKNQFINRSSIILGRYYTIEYCVTEMAGLLKPKSWSQTLDIFCLLWTVPSLSSIAPTFWLCPKSLPNHYIVHYIVTTPFCSGVRMFSDHWCSLYSALNVSHNSPWNVMNIWWSLTGARYSIMQRFAFAAGWEWPGSERTALNIPLGYTVTCCY